MGINKFNAEGYYDPTAYEAMTNIAKEEKAFFAYTTTLVTVEVAPTFYAQPPIG